jgi:Domain of unknown function (DUF4160)
VPTIAYFYGIAIQMYYNDHNPPHFHARYGGAKGLFRISDGTLIVGELPETAIKLIREWALARRSELEQNWQRGREGRPMEKVPGPDDRA